MRIISGTSRGRRLKGPAKSGSTIRPTADRAREALFNIIFSRLDEARVLDLFAGTGALALEALSRGAALAVAIDNGAQSLRLLKENRALCGYEQSLHLFKRPLHGNLQFLLEIGQKYGPFDLVFMDPPYDMGLSLPILTFVAEHMHLLAEQAMLIVEDVEEANFPDEIGPLVLHDVRNYGMTGFWFYGQRKL